MSNSNENRDSTQNNEEDTNSLTTPTADESTPSEAASDSTSNQNLGYCHSCDRQVPIDQDSFTCNVCNGGFIELLEAEQEPQQQPHVHRILNDGSNPLGSILPLLLPQLMGQNVGAQRININQQNRQGSSAPGASATRLQFIVPNSEPGAQVDLYGIINNVLSDLLRPGAAGGSAPGGFPNTQFHFQPSPIRMFQLHGDMRDYAWGAGGLDTIITQLLNQLENTGPPPASEQQMLNLPVVKINEEEFEKKIECAICMEDFRLHEEAKKLPCKHYFHQPCITEWLKLHGTCPVCRKNLNGEDTSQREYISRPDQEDGTQDTTESAGSTQTLNPTSTETSDNNNSESSSTRTNNNSTSNPQVYHDMDFD